MAGRRTERLLIELDAGGTARQLQLEAAPAGRSIRMLFAPPVRRIGTSPVGRPSVSRIWSTPPRCSNDRRSSDEELALELVGAAFDLDVPGQGRVQQDVGSSLVPVPLEAALVLDRDDAVPEADLRHRTVEARAVQVVEVLRAPDQQLVRPRLEEQPGPLQPADRRGMLGSARRRTRGVAEGRRLVAGDGGHPRQEVVDDGEVGLAVAADLLGALLADPAHRRLDGGDLLGHDLDDHPPPVGRVRTRRT